MRATILLLGAFVMLSVASCQKGDYTTPASAENSLEKKGGGGKGNGKGDNEDPAPNPDPVEYAVTYQISEVDDPDALYRFSISSSGQLMLLETDPTITSWGTDYWGYWSSPYTYANGQVDYTIGLGRTIYTFTQVSANTIDVTKTLITSSYPSSRGGTTTTTVSHPGTYTIVP
ncbi:MAG: hypothetical protein H6551_13500 [Chitinophagales bacterium]|nr:hypothetical protein [Chitinophagaceae bacterium]MCB9066149.1 hypothetical protein [Chitinophagales bacterium]